MRRLILNCIVRIWHTRKVNAYNVLLHMTTTNNRQWSRTKVTHLIPCLHSDLAVLEPYCSVNLTAIIVTMYAAGHMILNTEHFWLPNKLSYALNVPLICKIVLPRLISGQCSSLQWAIHCSPMSCDNYLPSTDLIILWLGNSVHLLY